MAGGSPSIRKLDLGAAFDIKGDSWSGAHISMAVTFNLIFDDPVNSRVFEAHYVAARIDEVHTNIPGLIAKVNH